MSDRSYTAQIRLDSGLDVVVIHDPSTGTLWAEVVEPPLKAYLTAPELRNLDGEVAS